MLLETEPLHEVNNDVGVSGDLLISIDADMGDYQY